MRFFAIFSLTLGTAIFPVLGKAQILESIEAKVNGEIIFTSELDEAMKVVWLLNTGRSIGSMTQGQYDELRARVLQERIKDIVLSQECKSILDKRGFDHRLSDREIDRLAKQEYDRYRAKFDSEEAMRKNMQKNGVTEESLKAECRYIARQQYWLQYVAPRMVREQVPRVTKDEVDAFKKTHPNDWKKLDRISISHILLRVPENASPDQEAEIKKKAETIALRAEAGEDFAALARQFSQHEETRDKGGLIGWVYRGEMFPQFDQLFDLPVGKPSQPIRTKLGYHIVLVHKRVSLVDALYQRKLLKRRDEWIKEIIQRPETRILSRVLRKGDLLANLTADATASQVPLKR